MLSKANVSLLIFCLYDLTIDESRVSKSPTVNALVFLSLGFSGSSVSKNPPAMQKAQAQSLGLEDSLDKEMATHSSILAWRNPWTTVRLVNICFKI